MHVLELEAMQKRNTRCTDAELQGAKSLRLHVRDFRGRLTSLRSRKQAGHEGGSPGAHLGTIPVCAAVLGDLEILGHCPIFFRRTRCTTVLDGLGSAFPPPRRARSAVGARNALECSPQTVRFSEN